MNRAGKFPAGSYRNDVGQRPDCDDLLNSASESGAGFQSRLSSDFLENGWSKPCLY
jgi:hypothetical protein